MKVEIHNNPKRTVNSTVNALQNFSRSGDSFFLVAGFHKPHVPLVAPQEFFDFYKTEEMQLPPDFNTFPQRIPNFPVEEFRDNIDIFVARPFSVREALAAECILLRITHGFGLLT